MPVMNEPAPQKPGAKRTGKRITFFTEQAMKEASQHQQDYYLQTGNAVDPGQSEAVNTANSNTDGHNMYLNSVIFSPDKGDQSRGGHYQQTVPMKWSQQEAMQQQQQQQRQAAWTNSMANWTSNYANFMGDTRSQVGFVKSMQEQQQQQPPLTNPTSTQPPSQSFQNTLKPGTLSQQQQQQQQQHGNASSSSSVLQPFQLAFGQPKTHLSSFYPAFQGNRTTSALPNPPSYQSKAPNVLPHNPVQIIQSQSSTQQQLVHEQRLNLQQLPHQRLNQQNMHDFFPSAQQPVVVHSNESTLPAPPKIPEPIIQDITPEPQQQTIDLLHQIQPSEPTSPQLSLRRSRRLSKEGGAPSLENPFLVSSLSASFPDQGTQIQNGAPTGVIQSTRRKRRVSQEVNLETLAQKASEMESLPSNFVKDPHRPWSPAEEGLNSKRSRDEGLVPLVIPVSVPVRRPESSPESREEPALVSAWSRDLGRLDHKPSVIVTRRRSLRNSLSDNSEQNGGVGDSSQDDDPKKSKRRPRPEPLFIPPPKPTLFIAPPVYSSITPYQSHLRSPVRLADNPLAMPPYTPPPILSPVREGSGLYFTTFLSSTSASVQGIPPATPKSARSLLRSNSSDITPPVLTSIGEATPVSLEPRINIGSRYQAEIPELRSRNAVDQDQHKAALVWAPLKEEENNSYQQKVQDLMHLACSSVFSGGGTNQELAHHCLFQCKGDVLAALSLMMLRNPIFPKSHHLSNYHYSGSDNWSAAERRQFNKGITAHKKDFFMVQKQVCTKTVAQCVEFYYTFKKQVKIGRNGVLLYGETEPEMRIAEDEVDPKPGSVVIMQTLEERPFPRVSLPPLPHPLVSKPRYDPQPRKPSPNTGHKGAAAAAQEGEFPCKKCGRIFYKVKSRSAHMKSHAEQEKKAAAQRQREAEERQRLATAALLAQQHNGTQQQTGDDSTNDESTDGEDHDDRDWH
ncbi:hypothetical protein NQD34_015997 [Periophthalmus magnuspinnatus]|nr:hypothetical protein NQD34_015997 [Periophthalmus magnuspinnatus]